MSNLFAPATNTQAARSEKYRPHKHGMHKTPTYRSWASMLSRCRNPNAPKYSDYGGRGIKVCKRWELFENFLEDIGERPAGTTLDRRNVDGHYEPGNCRWATKTRQQRNRRDTNIVTWNGETLSLRDWAERIGIPFDALRGRKRNGWPVDKMLTLPANKSNNVLRQRHLDNRDPAGRFKGRKS